MRIRNRRTTVIAVAALCAVALVVTMVVRSRSMSHRADAALDDLRSMPGVSSARAQNYPESDGGARDAIVTVSESATTKQVADVLAGARKAAAGESISDISVRVGAAHATISDRTKRPAQAAPALAALAALPHGSAEVKGYGYGDGYEATIDPDGQQPVAVARTALQLVHRTGAPDGNLYVGTQTNAVVTVDESIAGASRLLTVLRPYEKELRRVRVSRTAVSVTADAGVSTIDLHRALAPVVRDESPTRTLTVDGAPGETQIDGSGPTTSVTETAAHLRSRHLGLTGFSTDERSIKVAGATKKLTAKDLPNVQRALATLRPRLPRNSDITVERTPGGLEPLFSGSPADLSRMAPRAGAAAAKGYDVSWNGDFEVTVVMPPGAKLTTTTVKPAMAVARGLGWKGSLWVQIGEYGENADTETARFQSTATGSTKAVFGDVEDTEGLKRVWNATATDAGAAS
ncbi:MAG TPA: hypothetical protein VG502_01995 [Flexivirga sp.]|uniref:hypothetical protein n=1 Tax=Flexivirga sp. TaxID=1962927 RepID=UPI002B604BD2|nr:hypothetical protein [Flexivirga sp.]HWC21048.1 hypothetical protein [Flexivirga sp.]